MELLVLAVLTFVILSSTGVSSLSLQQQVENYKLKVSVLRRIQAEECLSTKTESVFLEAMQTSPTAVPSSFSVEDYQRQISHYKNITFSLYDEYVECRKVNSKGYSLLTTPRSRPMRSEHTTTDVTTTEITTMRTTEAITTTAPNTNATTVATRVTTASARRICQEALNLKQYWRADHRGLNLKAGGIKSQNLYACDIRKRLRWFRFTESAGNRMLNTCPPKYSCGSKYPMWTDDEMPQEVGVSLIVNAYSGKRGWGAESTSSNCKSVTRKLEVIRCSMDTDHDFVYKLVEPGKKKCSNAFCGMH